MCSPISQLPDFVCLLNSHCMPLIPSSVFLLLRSLPFLIPFLNLSFPISYPQHSTLFTSYVHTWIVAITGHHIAHLDITLEVVNSMSETYIIDPDGEVTIVLANANAPFVPAEALLGEQPVAVHDNPQSESLMRAEAESRFEKDHCAHQNEQSSGMKHVDDEDLAKSFVRFQVSAKHLTFASPVFRRLLTGGMRESLVLGKEGWLC